MRAIVSCTALLLACLAAQAQVTYTWTDITPSNASFASGVWTHPLDGRRLLARGFFQFGDTGKAFAFSDDGGATWGAPAAAVPYGAVFVHMGLPGVVYLTESAVLPNGRFDTPARDGHLYRSADFGRTWSVVYTTAPELQGFTADSIFPFASDPQDVHRLYATRSRQIGCGFAFPGCRATTNIGIFDSVDDGASWGTTGLPILQYPYLGYSFPAAPAPANPSRLFVTKEEHPVESRDRGATWVDRDVPLRWIVLDPLRANVMYGHRYYYDSVQNQVHPLLLRTDDGGVTWRNVFDSDTNLETVVIDPARSRVLWLSQYDFLYRSEDAGESWEKIPSPSVAGSRPSPSPTIVVSPAEPGVVYVVRANRLFRGVPSRRPDPVVVEFQYEGDRYWSTSLDSEAASQDYRLEPGHVSRTGLKWGAWRADDAPAGALGSCRFWPRPTSGLRTRVLVQQGFECEALRRDAGWILEAENEFFALPPNASGGCATGLVPVRRFHNLKADLNHRWVADPAVAADMRGRGWYDEGVRFCARPLGSNE